MREIYKKAVLLLVVWCAFIGTAVGQSADGKTNFEANPTFFGVGFGINVSIR